jgi:hypothetical protein
MEYSSLPTVLEHELAQLRESGYDVTAVEARIDGPVAQTPPATARALLDELAGLERPTGPTPSRPRCRRSSLSCPRSRPPTGPSARPNSATGLRPPGSAGARATASANLSNAATTGHTSGFAPTSSSPATTRSGTT